MEIRKTKNHEGYEVDVLQNIAFSFSNMEADSKEAYLAAKLKDDASFDPDAESEISYGAFLDGKLAGNVLSHKYIVNFDGGEYPMRGIGGVCCLPNYRKKGVIKNLMNRVLDDAYNDGAVFSFLYPFSTDFYRKFGYEAASLISAYSVEIPSIPPWNYGGSVVLCETFADYEGVAEVYNSFSRNINLSAVRDLEYWKEKFSKKPQKDGISTYLWKDNTDKPRAYFTCKVIDLGDFRRDMDITELCYADADALRAIMGFVRDAFSVFFESFKLSLPAGMDIKPFITEFRGVSGKTFTKMFCGGMLRIVNVLAAFQAAKAIGSGEVFIEVFDKQIQQNNGIWHVNWDKGGVSAEKAVSTAPKNKPCLSAPIHTLSALLTGAVDLKGAELLPDITVNGGKEALSRLFYSKIVYMYEHF